MTSEPTRREEWDEFQFSLVRDDLLFRVQRRLGLIPAEGLGIGRRAVFWVTVSWLPLVIWGFMHGRVLAGTQEESLLVHLSVHARLLLGIPALHFAEAVSGKVLGSLVPYMVTSGLVPAAALPSLKGALRDTARLRDKTLPWIVIAAVVLASSVFLVSSSRVEDLAWAEDPDGRLGFGVWWLALGRTVFMVLVVGWLWRGVLLFLLLRRFGAIGLALVPTHADRLAGLGILRRVPGMFSPVIFAVSAVLAAYWGHQVLYHGVHVAELRGVMIAFGVVILVVFLAPNLALFPLLKDTKRQALLQYGALIGRQGRLVDQRWIQGQTLEDQSLLSAPELGPVADMNSLFDSIARMHLAPIGVSTVAMVLLPAVLPMIPVLAIEIPIRQLLEGLAKALL